MIRVGIFGYGNLGRGVALAIRKHSDMRLVCAFTRRDPTSLSVPAQGVAIISADRVQEYADKIDVMILCGGSATDLPMLTPELARLFHTVDSFDTHERIPAHFNAVDAAARTGGKVALVAAGWDPGLFSVYRAYAQAILPDASIQTFWGKGVSQGHSHAIRGIDGVLDATQYTMPSPRALRMAKAGILSDPAPQKRHKRVCYVVAKDGADRASIVRKIKTMPHYFEGFDVTVRFVSKGTLLRRHAGLPHGGEVVCFGRTGAQEEHGHALSLALRLDSNPEFTANVLLACARATKRLADCGAVGARTMLDVPPSLLSAMSAEELRKKFL